MFIANTDRAWFDFLSKRAQTSGGCLDEVNFWQPSATHPMKKMNAGTPVFFRLKKPTFAIAGYGFFAHFQVLPVTMAWDVFQFKNGDENFWGFLDRIGGYRKKDLKFPGVEVDPLGCTVLRDAVFWPQDRWIPWRDEMGWADNIVQGKSETEPSRMALLMRSMEADARLQPSDFSNWFAVQEVDERLRVARETVQREGQGTFRLRLLDAYGRQCAITGEHTVPVLDAAHIQPYLGPQSNHIQNGLLLTKEFHALFDEGYVTVTPDYEVKVSEALREEWQNGRRYYPYDGQRLVVLPENPAARPSRDALAWHMERVFKKTG
jgi:putative restriction endonuclease